MHKYFASSGRSVPGNVWLGVSVEDRKYGLPRIDQLRKIESPIRFLSVEPLLEDLDQIDLAGIHWVIVGGESGPKARPMKPEWVESIKNRVKNTGSHFSSSNGADGVRTGRNEPRKIMGEFSRIKLGIKCLLRFDKRNFYDGFAQGRARTGGRKLRPPRIVIDVKRTATWLRPRQTSKSY